MLTIKVKESKFMRGDYSLFLSFPYNERMINIIRGFSERSWIKQSKEWEVPLDMLEELLEILEGKVIEEIPQFKGTLEELDNLTLGE